MRLSHLGTFGIVLLAVSSSLASTTLLPGFEESTSSTLDPSLENESTTYKEIPMKLEKSALDVTPNQERFRQALSQEQQQNCLSQLLCGVRPSNPPSKKTNYVNDLAYVVKEFFDIIDVGDSGDDEEDDEKKPDAKTKTKSKGEAKSPYYKITNVNTKPKIVQKDDIGDDEQDDDPIRNTEEALDKEVEFKYSGIKKITLEELVDDIRLRPEDIVVYKNRKGRSRTGRMMMSERASQDLRRKMRHIRVETDEKKKMSIAADIANKLRSPRQCRQLTQTSSSSCPLTREVIKYLQTNIANGAEKHKNETALATLNYAAQQGFLLVEGDKGQTHVVDQSPLVANSFVATDLKNPSVPNRFEKVTQQNTKKPVQKEAEKEKDEDEDGDADADEEDEDEDGEEDADEETDGNDDEEQDDQEDSGGNDQEDEEDEEEDEEEDQNRRRIAQAESAAAEEKIRAQQKLHKKRPSLPSGTIRVYGVPQSSFDNDFKRVASTIGNSNVHLFDQDDYDSVLMSGYPDDKLPSSSVQEKKKAHKAQSQGRNSNSHRHRKRRPAPASDSVEDEPSEDESSDDEPAVEESQSIIIKSSAQKQPQPFATPYVHHRNYFQNDRPAYDDRPTYDPRPLQMRTPINTDYRRPARFYPMSFPSYPRY